MHLHSEPHSKHSIEGYSDNTLQINQKRYANSIIVNDKEIIPAWNISSLAELNNVTIEPLLACKPDIIIIASHDNILMMDPLLRASLEEKRIGIEVMSIGAACRTFNVLLSEARKVVLGVIL